ncbi:hypothetical protein MNBD_ALPHA01-1238 [hydrothermal vent metagenome]|uniref:Uncharacterized protein n=1 Tax=hydrothermal vent metagenome TaxID=652676 RepID=A0A3B0SIF1_9ZZZZ
MLYDIQQRLQESISLHQAGKTGDAINICKKILTLAPKEPNVLQLLGAFTKANGDYEAAEEYMLASLSANKNQPHVHNNLGNLYLEQENYQKAVHCYRKATRLEEKYADAWYNWAVVLDKQNMTAESIELVKKAIKYDPDQAKYHNFLGLLYKHQKNYPDAIASFEKALKIQPGYIKAIHNMGTVCREERRYEEARNCFNFVLNNKPDQVETWEAIGSLHQNTEDFDRSVVAYQKLLALEPENLKIHRVLNNMMWETGRHQGFLGSYLLAMEARPDSPDIVAAYAEELAIGGAYEQAAEVIGKALERQGEHPELFHRLAHLKLKEGDRESARHLFEKTLALVSDNYEYHTDFAELLLETGEYDYALEQVSLAEKIYPDFQKIWTVRGDCWRLIGDERYYWLCDYENLVQPMEIKVPEGFANIDNFNQALEEELTRLHITDVNPRDQTLIGGTQTIGDLYLNHNPVIQKLRIAVLDAAARYIKALPDDENHPHLRRKTDKLKFTGAWSVRLKSEGFHVDHYHPKGWISGPYYVKLPAVVNDSTSDGERPGWVNFGASRYGPEKDRIAERIIKPQTGLQVFFPSYMWHGTNAFQSDEIRMTAPCDIVPA